MLAPSSTFREFFINVAVAALTFFCLEAWRKAIGKPKAERDLQDESKDHEVLQQNLQGLPGLAASNGDLRPGRLPSPTYLPNFDDFIQAANNALDHAYPKQQQLTVPRYTRVTVLLIQWLKDDLGVTPELEKLGNVFRDMYGYDVRPIYSIPETGSDSALLTQIEQLTQDAAPDHLLVVYYGGHSDNSDPVNSIWRSHKGSNASVKWGVLHAYLALCQSDVLTLLDTCYAGKGGSHSANFMGSMKGANEVIAATNESALAAGVGRFSFTKALTVVLKDFAERHKEKNESFTAVTLATYMRANCYPNPLKKAPYYIPIPEYPFDSCLIVPLNNSSFRFLGDPKTKIEKANFPITVLASINLKSSPDGNLVSWLQGQGAPAGYLNGVDGIQIVDIYRSDSCIILLRCPLPVWLLLPPQLSCTFIGLVRSGNLLREPQVLREKSEQVVLQKSQASPEIASTPTGISSIPWDPPPAYSERELAMAARVLTKRLQKDNEEITSGFLRFPQLHLSHKGPSFLRLQFNHFRLLQLYPGSEDDPLSCQFISVDLSAAPKYTALSYVWDTSRTTENYVIISGYQTPIMPNLHSALKAFRRLDESIQLWIDAICINQSDKEEMSMQVALIPRIFSRAADVRIWLGESTFHTQLAFPFARWITKPLDALETALDPNLLFPLIAFFALMRDPWFRRKWVLQEIAFASKVAICWGREVLDWETFAQAICIIQYLSQDLLKVLRNMKCPEETIRFLEDFGAQGATLAVELRYDLLSRSSGSSMPRRRTMLTALAARTALLVTSSPRDTIYSLTELASDQSTIPEAVKRHDFRTITTPEASIIRGMIIDYPRSTLEMYKDFVRLSIETSGSLDIICQPWALQKTPHDALTLPSWVCTTAKHPYSILEDNQYIRVNADCLVDLAGLGTHRYNASGRKPPQFTFKTVGESSRLVGGGLCFDKILQIAPPALRATIPLEWAELAGWDTSKRRQPEEFWRTLVADRTSDGREPPLIYKRACEDVLTDKPGDVDIRGLLSFSPPKIIHEFLKRAETVVWGRRLVKTGEGRLGLVPRESKEGDLICILLGCSVPVVLRRIAEEDRDAGVTLIGACYIHGMMQGEALTDNSDGVYGKSGLKKFEIV